MMEEQMNPLAITHLLQHTLRSLCIHDNSQWVYAVFWRILPRNYPPPKWDGQGAYDRSRGNRRNWILVWEDGFCNFAASTAEMNSGECPGSSVYGNCEFQHYQGLQPELFFKMSHEIYNYGEGLIGKVAADQSHKWIHKEPNDQEINFLSTWHNSADFHPRTWEAQFQSGIKTIALIAVREGVVQLGAVQKVIEDLSYVVLLRKKFSYIESIPGVLLPHPSSANYPFNTNKLDAYGYGSADNPNSWHYHHQAAATCNNLIGLSSSPTDQYYIDGGQFISNNINQNDNHPLVTKMITPSMSSLEALLSKLPSVVPPLPALASSQPPMGFIHISDQDHDHQKLVAKEEEREDQEGDHNPYNHRDHHDGVGESSNSFSGYPREQYVNYHHPQQF